MLLTIEQFRSRISDDCVGLIQELRELTGRYGSEEAHAWEKSLRQLSTVFQAPSFQPLHLYFGSRGNLALEYQLPASSSWCDVVLLGAHQAKPAAVIVELKDWLTRSDKPGRYEGLIERQGAQELHPSDQVRGYTEYCRRFHSAVSSYNASVHGCVLFTRDPWAPAYGEPPNVDLAANYPVFTISSDNVNARFPKYFENRLTCPDAVFAAAFADGHYRQDRGFVAQIGEQILKPEAYVFELLDNQRKAFTVCRSVIAEALGDSSRAPPRKKVVIIKGPPGSGKSVIAARLWASLVTDSRLPPGDVVFTTTSMSQNSNWMHLFSRVSGDRSAGGIVRKATNYSPITTHRLGQLREKHGENFLADAQDWRENLRTLCALGERYRDGACDDQNLISIVDEAHALINPEKREGRGQFGFATTLGPQAYHIIRSSLLSVFLLDPLQGFRQRENTSIEEIRQWAREQGAGEPEEVSLEGVQFRCAGSVQYVGWLESLLAGASANTNKDLSKGWYDRRKSHQLFNEDGEARATPTESGLASRAAEPGVVSYLRSLRANMDFGVFDNPEACEEMLRKRSKQGNTVRLLSTYSRPWKTEKSSNPHVLSPSLMDFHEPYNIGGETRHWNRIWNFVPHKGSNYTWFVTGHPGGQIARDPLCEVGCPYAVRGFDYDYVGILWLDDLVWRDNRWRVAPTIVEERGMKELITAARREQRRKQEGPATAELLERVLQAYRILFTRALKGVYVWVPDRETREHLLASLD